MKNIFLPKYLITFLLIFYAPYSLAKNTEEPQFSLYCAKGSQLQLARSQELKALAKADQADRENSQFPEKEAIRVAHRDLIRRKRVGEIFGEGCFQDPNDYLEAALIYQHGETSDHFYQAFIWSKRAAELGELSGKSFSALAIDRYLISIGKKQLFGSQYQKLPPNPCYCMQPVEQSFPDSFRKEYSGRSLDENYKLMTSINEKSCPSLECSTQLQPTHKADIMNLRL